MAKEGVKEDKKVTKKTDKKGPGLFAGAKEDGFESVTLPDGMVMGPDGKPVDPRFVNIMQTFEAPFSKLVTTDKPLDLCRPETKRFRMPGDRMKLPPGYDVYGGPKRKQNNYMAETEKFDQVVYFFDYLDDVFQKDVSKELAALLEEASKIPEEDPKRFDDPYSAEKLLYYFSNGVEGRDPMRASGPPVNIDPMRIVQYKRDFDVDLWKKSFGAAKISNIIKAFGWGTIPPQPYFFKMLIDKFDFDGNGRLDPKEFIFYAIWENYKNYFQCRKHCFKGVIESKINPLFTFFDCDNDGYISSENLWEGCKYLKRKDPEQYNFYRCEVPKVFNKHYRTHAPNDFVLKNYDIADGFLSREEFRKGILLGYWERQVNAINVVDDDSINRKDDRWDGTGKIDKDCQELLQMYDRPGM